MIKTEEKVFGLIAKNDRGDFIRVARVIPEKGLEAIDIRNFYTPEGGDPLPTQKGVRMNSECMVEVTVAILKAMEPEEFNEVMDAFKEEYPDG